MNAYERFLCLPKYASVTKPYTQSFPISKLKMNPKFLSIVCHSTGNRSSAKDELVAPLLSLSLRSHFSPAEYFIACNRSNRSTRCTAHVLGDINLLTDLMVKMRHLRTIFRLNYGRNRTSGAVAISVSAEERENGKKGRENPLSIFHGAVIALVALHRVLPTTFSNARFVISSPELRKERRRRESRTRIEADESHCAKLRNIQLAMRRFQWQIKQRANTEQHFSPRKKERERSRAEATSIRQCVRVVDSVLSIHRIRSDT